MTASWHCRKVSFYIILFPDTARGSFQNIKWTQEKVRSVKLQWNNFGIINNVGMVQPDQLICLIGHGLYSIINQVFMLTGATLQN